MGDVPRTYVRTVRTNEQMTHARGLPRLTGNCSRAAPLPTSWFDTRWCVPRPSRSSLERARRPTLSFSFSPSLAFSLSLSFLLLPSLSLSLSFSFSLLPSFAYSFFLARSVWPERQGRLSLSHRADLAGFLCAVSYPPVFAP